MTRRNTRTSSNRSSSGRSSLDLAAFESLFRELPRPAGTRPAPARPRSGREPSSARADRPVSAGPAPYRGGWPPPRRPPERGLVRRTHRDVAPHPARARRVPDPAALGSGRRARSDSRRSPGPRQGGPRRSAPASGRTARGAGPRRSFGIASYAASRTRMCRNRNASSTSRSDGADRMSSLRTSDMRCPPSAGLRSAVTSSATAPKSKTSPTTAAPSSTLTFRLVGSCSRRGREQRLDRRRDGESRRGGPLPPMVAVWVGASPRVDDMGRAAALRRTAGCREKRGPGDRGPRPVRGPRPPAGGLGVAPSSPCPRAARAQQPVTSPTTWPSRDGVPTDPCSQTQQQDWDVARPLEHVSEEVEERFLAPMDVVEDEHDWSRPGEPLDEAAHGPECLLGDARAPRPRPTSSAT